MMIMNLSKRKVSKTKKTKWLTLLKRSLFELPTRWCAKRLLFVKWCSLTFRWQRSMENPSNYCLLRVLSSQFKTLVLQSSNTTKLATYSKCCRSQSSREQFWCKNSFRSWKTLACMTMSPTTRVLQRVSSSNWSKTWRKRERAASTTTRTRASSSPN